MDRKHIGMTIAVTFLLVIITMTIKAQISSIEASADISQETVAHTTRSAATVLHLRNSSQSQKFGKVERDEFEDLVYDCGKNSGLAALNGDIDVARDTTLSTCTGADEVERYWAENGLLAGIVVVEEDGEQQLEWVVVA